MAMKISKRIVPTGELSPLKKVEEIQVIEEEASEEVFKEEDHTLITLDVKELLVI